MFDSIKEWYKDLLLPEKLMFFLGLAILLLLPVVHYQCGKIRMQIKHTQEEEEEEECRKICTKKTLEDDKFEGCMKKCLGKNEE